MKRIRIGLFGIFIMILPLQSCLLSGSESNENVVLTGFVQEGPAFLPKANVEVEINDSIKAKTDSKGTFNAKIQVESYEFKKYESKAFKMKLKLEKDTVVDLTVTIVDTTWSNKNPIKKHIFFDYVNLK